MFYRKGVLKSFAKVKGKGPVLEQAPVSEPFLMNATLLKKRLRHRFFPVNFAKIFRALSFYRTPPNDCFWKHFLFTRATHVLVTERPRLKFFQFWVAIVVRRWNVTIHDLQNLFIFKMSKKFFESCITWEYVSFDSLCLYNPNQAWSNFGQACTGFLTPPLYWLSPHLLYKLSFNINIGIIH